MARAGMTRWRGRNASGTEGGDDVQKSLELLDKVLSEFDDLENGNVAGEGGESSQTLRSSGAGRSESSETTTGNVSSTPEDDSPSLGHQSEDDGYMSMNGRRAKFVLSFRPVPDEGGFNELPPAPDPPPDPPPHEMADYPPPPEEAQRIISNLLPRVSPVNSGKKNKQNNHQQRRGKGCLTSMTLGSDIIRPHYDKNITTATQTTLPKTRHQRPYGWENGTNQPPFHLQEPPQPPFKFGSLPFEGALQHSRYPPPWLQRPGPLPPRTLAAAVDRHREVRRRNSGETASPRHLVSEYKEETFSDDSLEESLPPPPPTKRGSIAWEVPLGFEEEDPLYTPGSTKVIGRRRRKSTEHSSNSSIHRLKEVEDWPEPPPSTEDDTVSPYSDSIYDSTEVDEMILPETLPLDLTFNGTYVIRKGRKKERSPVKKNLSLDATCGNSRPPRPKYDRQSSLDARLSSMKANADLKRASSTFDNIKLLIKEGLIEGLDDAPPDFPPPTPPNLVRVVSLPTLPTEETDYRGVEDHRNSKCERFPKITELGVTLEEAEDELSSLDNPSLNHDVNCESNIKTIANQCNGAGEDKKLQTEERKSSVAKKCEMETQTDLSDIETQNELELVGKQIREISKTRSELEEVEKKIQEIVKIKTVYEKQAREEEFTDPWVKVSDLENTQAKPVPVLDKSEEKPPDEFRVNVEVLQHEFGPLPPSPVDEDDDEYSEIFHLSQAQTPRGKADTLPEPFYRCQEPPGSDPSGKYLNRPPEPPPHRASDPISNSLKTRSMDAGFSRGPRAYCNGSRRESGAERRTLPSELPGPVSRRRTFQKRSSTSPQESMQTSCSLPETPIFARGCDIPRTPHRRAPEPIPRPCGLQTGTYRRNGTLTNASNCGTGVSLSGGLNQAIVGAELLRMAGGPGRGWYPRHRQPRPASIEHLDRLSHSGNNGLPGPWDMGSARKPMTLPPNITPKFFHRSPRDALRRVTSLLIRGKGTTSKENKKEVLPPPPPPATSIATNRFGDTTDHSRQKKGFFKNFWKRSRHYSLDHQ